MNVVAETATELRQPKARADYESMGYVVFPDLIPAPLLDAVVSSYEERIKPSRKRFFRQNTSRYEVNRVNGGGHVQQSFLDIHAYESEPAFREAVLNVYFCREIREALSEVTAEASHRLMQSMLFDANTATWPHQDCWYLDSVPSGRLLAAWIALEDIDERAGRFYLLPASQHSVLHEPGLPHSNWVGRVQAHVEQHASEVDAPALKRGDVLFWHSRTIHGSLPTQDERLSRRSLTAHYLPTTQVFGNIFKTKKFVTYRSWRGFECFNNQPEWSLKADAISRIKRVVYDHPTIMGLARRFQRRAISDI